MISHAATNFPLSLIPALASVQRLQTIPAVVQAAVGAVHVVAATVLLDGHVASRAGLHPGPVLVLAHVAGHLHLLALQGVQEDVERSTEEGNKFNF